MAFAERGPGFLTTQQAAQAYRTESEGVDVFDRAIGLLREEVTVAGFVSVHMTGKCIRKVIELTGEFPGADFYSRFRHASLARKAGASDGACILSFEGQGFAMILVRSAMPGNYNAVTFRRMAEAGEADGEGESVTVHFSKSR